VTKYYYEDAKAVFSLLEESGFFRLRIEESEIEEHHVEEFMDKTVEWLSANSDKGILIDFDGVEWVCSDFTAHLARYYEDIKAKGLSVDLVNVAPALRPYVDVHSETVTESVSTGRPVLSISTKQVLEDLEDNLSNQELMNKHGLSLRGLASLFKKLSKKGLITREDLENRMAVEVPEIEIELDSVDLQKTKILAQDVLKDVADDMSDEMLMRKYKLSRKGLESMWTKLSLRGLISEEALLARKNGEELDQDSP